MTTFILSEMILLAFSIFCHYNYNFIYSSQLKSLESEDEIVETNRQKQVVESVDGRVNVKASLYN